MLVLVLVLVLLLLPPDGNYTRILHYSRARRCYECVYILVHSYTRTLISSYSSHRPTILHASVVCCRLRVFGASKFRYSTPYDSAAFWPRFHFDTGCLYLLPSHLHSSSPPARVRVSAVRGQGRAGQGRAGQDDAVKRNIGELT